MKKITSAFLASFLMLSAVACSTARTSSSAPDSAAQPQSDLTEPTAATNQDDATSELRRRQLNSDIRASEQRHDALGEGSERTDRDLESEVRSKLEANLPASELAIEAKEGVVTVTGTVVDQAQLDKIERLAREINGVKGVNVKANVASAAEPKAPAANSDKPIGNHTGTQSN